MEPARIWQVDGLKDRIDRIEKERRDEKEEERERRSRRQMLWIYFAFALLWTEIVVSIVLVIVKHAH